MRVYASAMTGGDIHAVDEILQESAIHIWEHRHELPEIKNLRSWACRIAYFKMLSLKRVNPGRLHVEFSEQLAETLASDMEVRENAAGEQLQILAQCLGKVRPKERALLSMHYEEHITFRDIARQLEKNEDAVYQQISRLRRALRRCVEKKSKNAGLPPPPR